MLRAADTILHELAKGSASCHRQTQLEATQSLKAHFETAELPAIEQALDSLLEPLRQQLLLCEPPLFIQTCEVVQVLALRLGRRSSALVCELLPLLIDHCACASATSLLGHHAHQTVCSILRHVDDHDALPKILAALAARCTSSARRMLAEQLLLCLLLPGHEAALRRRAQIIALSLARLLSDPAARTRTLARHAFLVLMERLPRATTEPFGRLPLPTQRALQLLAKRRSSALGGSPLPPPSPLPPHCHAALLQAAARGRAARLSHAAHRAYVCSLPLGARVEVGGLAATLRYRGAAAFAPGEWVGVELDWPAGRHDGAAKGQRYFRCAPRCGLLVRAVALAPPRAAAAARGSSRPAAEARKAEAEVKAEAKAKEAEVKAEVKAKEAEVKAEVKEAEAEAEARRAPPATPRAPPAAAAPVAPPPLRTLLASHKGVLQNIKQIAEGQLALVKGHEAASVLAGDSKMQMYLKQMDMLAGQQRLLACQLHDSLQPLIAPPPQPPK